MLDRNDVRIFILIVMLMFPLFIKADTISLPSIELDSRDLDVGDIRVKRDRNRKPREQLEVLPRLKNDNSKHMSPPNVSYKYYCVNKYLYVMFIITYGWNPETGTAERIETQLQQQFDRNGRAVMCR